MKCFSIFDVMKNLSSFNFTFSDNSIVTFTVNDLMNYLKWKSKNIPYYDDNELKIHDDISSFNLLWDAFNNNNKESFTRIKDALGLTYNVLENYNGVTETEETETYDTADALSFANRLDTTTLSHSDTTTHNTTDTTTLSHSDTTKHNTTDTETRNTQTRDSSDATTPKTTTRAINEHKTVSHYTTGFNGESAVLEYEDVTLADANGKGGTLNDEVITETGATLSSNTGTIANAKTGTEITDHMGTITDGKTGTETTAHSGTITDGKTGTETTSKTGTVTREYTENKHGNLGLTTPVQMIGGECELRLKYKLRPMIIKSFIDEYFYL